MSKGSLFKPVLVKDEQELSALPREAGQFIVVRETRELWLDCKDERIKLSTGSVPPVDPGEPDTPTPDQPDNPGGGDDPNPDAPITPTTIKLASFTMDIDSTQELGSTVNPVLSWAYSPNNATISQTLQGKQIEASLRSTKLSGIKSDVDIVLKGTSSNTVSGTLSIKFLPRMYNGTTTKEGELTSEDIVALGDREFFDSSYLGEKVYDCTGGKYITLIVPTTDANRIYITDSNGFKFTGYNTYTVDVTSDMGVKKNYTVFKMNRKYYSPEVKFIYSLI